MTRRKISKEQSPGGERKARSKG